MGNVCGCCCYYVCCCGCCLPEPPYYEELFLNDPDVKKPVTVQMESGSITGFVPRERKSAEFRGIQYATLSSPFAKPVLHRVQGSVSAKKYGPACPQVAYGSMRMVHDGAVRMLVETMFMPSVSYPRSWAFGRMEIENCLNLNVYTPAETNGALPVLVWIHGGAFAFGSNIEGGLGDLHHYVEKGNIVGVSINYRLHLYGFAKVGDDVSNNGLRDQICALEWVQQNIGAFGGNPNNVTIMGESAGAIAITALMASPRAKGLFHRAIASSGNAKCKSLREMETLQEETAKLFGKDASTLTKSDLDQTPHETVIKYGMAIQKAFEDELGTNIMAWGPGIDNDVIPEAGVMQSLREGSASGIPLLISFNTDELEMFVGLFASLGATGKILGDDTFFNEIRSYHHQLLSDGGDYSKSLADFEKLYKAVLTDKLGREPEHNELRSSMLTFVTFSNKVHEVCEAHAEHGPVQLFMFDMKSQFQAGHGVDLFFTFDFPFEDYWTDNLFLDFQEKRSAYKKFAHDFQMAHIEFMKAGRVDSFRGESWPAYPACMVLKEDPEVNDGVRREASEFQNTLGMKQISDKMEH